MKRYEVMWHGQPLMVYGNSAEEVQSKYTDSYVKELPYPAALFDKLTAPAICHAEQKVAEEIREYRIVDEVIYRISRDVRDNQYYDLVQYRHVGGRLVMPCLWSCCTAQEFADRYMKKVPLKETGFVITPKQIKKLAKPFLRKNGMVMWRDADDYFYIGYKRDWGKYVKDEYDVMSQHRDTAVFMWYSDASCSYKKKWFTSVEDFYAQHPENPNLLPPHIIKKGYRKLPVNERKLICRLPYYAIARELAEGEHPEHIALDWSRRCADWGDVETLLDIVKEVANNA